MSDVAKLGLEVDSSGVETARQRLDAFRQAGDNASDSTARFQRAIEDLARAQDKTNQLIASHADALRGATQQTNSYIDTLARWAVAAGAVYTAYQGIHGALSFANDGLREQVSLVEKIRDGLQSIAMYGRDAFQFMSPGSIAAQRDLSMTGQHFGVPGSTIAGYQQTVAPLGAPASANMAAYSSFHQIFTGTDTAALAGRATLANLGVTGGTEEQQFRSFIDRLQGMQPGDRRNAIASQILSPGGASIADDTIAKLAQLTDLQRQVNQLTEANANTERQAAENRRKDDADFENFKARTPGFSLFSSQQISALGANSTLAYEQMAGRDPNSSRLGGVGTFFRGLGSYITGGQPAGTGNAFYQVAQPGFASPNALDTRPAPPITGAELTQGYGDLASGGYGAPAQLNAITDLVDKLNANLKTGKVYLDEYNNAMARLTRTAGDIADPLAALRRTVSFGHAAADAADSGSYAATIAQIEAEERDKGKFMPGYDVNGAISLRTQQVDDNLTRSANEQQFSIWDQSSAQVSAIRARMSGGGGALALLAGARSRARRALPFMYGDDDNSVPDITDPTAQAYLREEGMGMSGNADNMLRTLDAQIKQRQKNIGSMQSGDGAGAMMSVRQFAGIDVMTSKLRELADATDASNEKGAQAKQLYLDQASALDKDADALDKLNKQHAAAALDREISGQVKSLNDRAAAIGSGASEYDVAYAQNVDSLTKRAQASGAPTDKVGAYAKQLTDSQIQFEKATDTQKQWGAAVNNTVDILAQGVGKLTTSGKNFRSTIESIGQQLDQEGIQAFIVNPLKNLLNNLIGNNANNSSLFSFGAPGASSGGGIIGSFFSSIFGGAGGSAGDGGVSAAILANQLHTGGMVGEGGTMRLVPADIFRNAQRYHSGGLLPDEVPIIGLRGERMQSREEVRNGGQGGQSVTNHITMHVHATDAASFNRTRGQTVAALARELNKHGH